MKVTQSCPTLCNPMDYMVHGILQDRILDWVAFPFSRGSSQPGIKPMPPALQVDSLPAESPGKLYPCIIILISEAWLSVQVTFTALYHSLYKAIIQGKPNVSRAASLTSFRDDVHHEVNIFIFKDKAFWLWIIWAKCVISLFMFSFMNTNTLPPTCIVISFKWNIHSERAIL